MWFNKPTSFLSLYLTLEKNTTSCLSQHSGRSPQKVWRNWTLNEGSYPTCLHTATGGRAFKSSNKTITHSGLAVGRLQNWWREQATGQNKNIKPHIESSIKNTCIYGWRPVFFFTGGTTLFHRWILNLPSVPSRRERMQLESKVERTSSALHLSLFICTNHTLQQQVMNAGVISGGNKGCSAR